MPKVCVLKSNYDFKTRYSLVTNPISGFTKTARDPFTVQGWRVRRGTTGLTEITWQPVASLTAPWLGCDHKSNGTGFVKLRGRPVVSHSTCDRGGGVVYLSGVCVIAIGPCAYHDVSPLRVG